MKWILTVIGALALLVAIAYGVGARLPREHVATVRAHFRQPPDSIYRVLMDVATYPSWRSDVDRVEREPDRNGHIVWRERERMGGLEYEFTVAVRPTRLVSAIITPDAGFTGRWIYQILPDADGTVLTITEEGTVENPLFRFLSRYLFGNYGSMETMLRSLGKRFGEVALPVRVI
jgi:uncharacterized protein YndB with AHSA1/START domain